MSHPAIPWDIVGQLMSYVGVQPKFTYYAYINKISTEITSSDVNYKLFMGLRIDDSSSIFASYISFELHCGKKISLPYNDSDGPITTIGSIVGEDIKSLRIYVRRDLGKEHKGIPLDRIPGLPKLIEIIQESKKSLSKDELITKIKKEVPEIGWNF